MRVLDYPLALPMFVLLCTLLCPLLCPISSAAPAPVSQQQLIERLMDDITVVTRTIYSDQVIAKLTRDGTGAAIDYTARKGFVPPPEKLIRQILLNTLVEHKLAREKQLSLTLNAETLTIRLSNPSLTRNQQARLVAALLNRTIHAISDAYTALVVDKLTADGTGAAHDHASQPGFVPLPSVFIRDLLQALEEKQRRSGQDSFAIALLSRWNLNPQQGLNEDFAVAGWKFLARQQQTHLASRRSLRSMVWQPYLETTYAGDKLVLHFLDAVTAASPDCVACHNQWEQRKTIRTQRKRQGVEVGKTFRHNELMAVLAITLPLE